MNIEQHSAKVGVVGAGPAGITAAHALASEGIPVLLIDAASEIGGTVRTGYSPWSKAREHLRHLEAFCQHPLITWIPNTSLGTDLTLEELSQKCSVVIFAVGAGPEKPLEINEATSLMGRGVVAHHEFRNTVSQWHQTNQPWINWPEALLNSSTRSLLQGVYPDKNQWHRYLFECMNGAIIPGGGRASLEVAKTLVAWCVGYKLWQYYGRPINPVEIITHGILQTLTEYKNSLAELGIHSPTILHWKDLDHMTLFTQNDHTQHQQAIQKANRKAAIMAQNDCVIIIAPYTTLTQIHTDQHGVVAAVTIEGTYMDEEQTVYISPNSGTIIPTRLIIPTLGNQSAALLNTHPNEPAIFFAGAAAGITGGFNSHRRHGKYIASQVIEHLKQQT